MPNLSALLKMKARQALAGHWQTALLISLAVALPALLAQGLSILTGNDIQQRLADLLITLSRDGQMTPERLSAGLDALIRDSGIWTLQGVSLLARLLTPVLSLGMLNWVLMRLKNQEAGVATVFSRLRVAHKSIGLHLLVVFKILLWMLPGAAVSFLSLIPLSGRIATQAEALSALRTGSAFIYLGMGLMIVPAVMAALRYAMAEYILAEAPESRVLECVRRSKALMKNRKGMLFSLEISFVFWYLAEYVIATLLEGMGAGVLSLMFQMLAGIALSVYIAASVGAFYLTVTASSAEGPETAPQAGEEDAPLS